MYFLFLCCTCSLNLEKLVCDKTTNCLCSTETVEMHQYNNTLKTSTHFKVRSTQRSFLLKGFCDQFYLKS